MKNKNVLQKQIQPGAVWHGFWDHGLVKNQFGSPGKPHYAMRLEKADNRTQNFADSVLPFFPFSSKKNSSALLTLQPGTLPFGRRDCFPYLIGIRLLVRKSVLSERFRHLANLPESLCTKAEQNYFAHLQRRKMK